MDGVSTGGVFSVLSQLEAKERSRRGQPHQRSRLDGLRAEVEELTARREQLKAEIQTHKNLQKLRLSTDKEVMDDDEEEMDEDSQMLRLMAKHTELKDLLHVHHIIGGYDVIKTRQGKGMCVSLTTSYEGVYLDTYNLDIDLKPRVRIVRHNIPPFIPMNELAERSNMQTDPRAFLGTLRLHLNAFAGRKQQLKLIKEQHKSVEVMESNVLCSILVLLLTASGNKTPVLCTLDYADHARTLPTRVHVECEDKLLPDSPEWKKSCSLLMEIPADKVLMTMKKTGIIV